MSTYNDLVQWVIETGIPSSAPVSDTTQYYGQVGDFFGGVWGTIIGVITLLVVLATWHSTRKIDARSKIYQIFAEILRTHEEIVTSMRLGNLDGRDSLKVVLSEFYEAYKAIKNFENLHQVGISMKCRINAAFLLVYYGTHPDMRKILEIAAPEINFGDICDGISQQKKSNKLKSIGSELSCRLSGDPAQKQLWNQSIRDGFQILRSVSAPTQDIRKLQEILATAQQRPHNHLNPHKILEFIESYSTSTEFGGHQNRLSHYFRNLHSAFMFIDEQKLSKREKHSLSKVIRSKLSNYEQALLAINSISAQGSSWISSGLINKYMPIKNIPEHFFHSTRLSI